MSTENEFKRESMDVKLSSDNKLPLNKGKNKNKKMHSKHKFCSKCANAKRTKQIFTSHNDDKCKFITKHCSKCASIHNYCKVIESHNDHECRWIQRHCEICYDTGAGDYKTHNMSECRDKDNVMFEAGRWEFDHKFDEYCDYDDDDYEGYSDDSYQYYDSDYDSEEERENRREYQIEMIRREMRNSFS